MHMIGGSFDRQVLPFSRTCSAIGVVKSNGLVYAIWIEPRFKRKDQSGVISLLRGNPAEADDKA